MDPLAVPNEYEYLHDQIRPCFDCFGQSCHIYLNLDRLDHCLCVCVCVVQTLCVSGVS